MGTIRLFSFRIYNIAYKNVQPLLLEVNHKKTNPILIFLASLIGIELVPLVWYLEFTYKDEKNDQTVDRIFFPNKEEATNWYNFIFEAVFLERALTPPPVENKKSPPPLPPKKPKPLEKLKKTDPKHLKVVKDDESKDKE